VITEVFNGARPLERARVEQFFAALQFLPTTQTAAQQAGVWRYDFARRGTILSTTDSIIAAVAFEHGATVVTGNVKDYPMVAEGLAVLPLPRVPLPPNS
jgi:predicted nucleic acid-binding protein